MKIKPYLLLKEFLDSKVEKYNTPEFINSDPIQIPHLFSKSQNIELAGFLTATLAWGQRCTIINKSKLLMQLMDNNPHDFITNCTSSDLKIFNHFVHRTFQPEDCKYFIKSLQNIYLNHGGLKKIFVAHYKKTKDIKECIMFFRKIFFELKHPSRTNKHFSNIEANAAGKRLNMFLRWMIRDDNKGVDFGLWNEIPASALYIPLDLHTGNVSRKLELLTRKQDDWQAVNELTETLRVFDTNDPIKYDFALFGVGVNEGLEDLQ